jgi:NADPH:quinone reductase-like Zn-dependent oxidoreductase
MKALVLSEINKPLIYTDTDVPELNTTEALVEVKYAALNHRDVWISKGLYAGIKTPIILGSDGCGSVVKTGSNTNSHWLGKPVIINPSINWGNNEDVQQKEYTILGLPQNGTFAQFVKVPINNLYDIPPHLNEQQAAAIPLAGLTAFRALFTRAQLKPTDTLLITGIGGGVALFALQFALAYGIKNVYVTSGSNNKLQKAISLGANGGVNYREQDWHKKLLSETGGFDVIIDSAGGKSFNYLIDLAKPGGKICFYGGTTGNFDNVSPQKIFWKQLTILGSTMGSDIDFIKMIHFINQHQITPVIDEVFPLKEGNQAFIKMEKSEQLGKILLQINT